MRNSLLILIMMFMTTGAFAQDSPFAKGESCAIVLVHFGTTFDETRVKTIEAINSRAAELFPQMEVLEAYTSRIVIRRLLDRGIEKRTPREVLLQLAAKGVKNVFVQATHVIDGIESEALRKEVAAMAPFFNDIRVGRPLFYSVEDCRRVSEILSERYSGRIGKGRSVVFIGHGTDAPANAIYPQMDYLFTAGGHPQIHVATVEGFPTLENVLERLKAERAKEVTLVPFMFVAGDHAHNDIDIDWRAALEEKGFSVSTVMEGLGEIPQIQEIYINHIKAGMDERPVEATERKEAYIKANL